MIQLFKPYMGDEEAHAVSEIIKSGWIGLGPKTAEFEKRFAEFVGVKCAVGVNSCTAALDLALKLLHVSHGDEVIVPTMTFVSTGHVVAYNLATPIFADIDEKTLSIDIEDIEQRITPRTKAIIPVHFAGRPVDIPKLRSRIRPDIKIIEDCAHATGGYLDNRSVGGLGDIGCFSFHAVKNLAMGDGGALTLNDQGMMERAKRLRWLGIDKGTWDRTSLDKSYWWEYFVDEVGLKCHLNDIAAVIGLVQLSKLSQMNERRQQISRSYFEGLKDVAEVILPSADNERFRSSWHIFFIKAQKRDELSAYLQARDISTGVHYKPIHTYRCYGNRATLPVAERVFKEILSLPMHPGLSDSDVMTVIDSIRKFYGR